MDANNIDGKIGDGFLDVLRYLKDDDEVVLVSIGSEGATVTVQNKGIKNALKTLLWQHLDNERERVDWDTQEAGKRVERQLKAWLNTWENENA